MLDSFENTTFKPITDKLVIPQSLANFKSCLPLVSRNSAKSADLGNIAPSGIGGPNGGTSFERDTARLKQKKEKYQEV